MPRLKLRPKIIIYSLLVLSPVLILAYFLVNENYLYVKQHNVESVSTRATVVRLAIDESISSSERFLTELAKAPAVRQRDSDALVPLFAQILPLYPNFTTLGVTDEQGQIIVKVQKGDTFSYTVSDRAYFQEVMKTGRPVVSGRLIGRATDQPVFVVAVPIKDEQGRVVGAVGAGISLEQIKQRLDRLGREAGDSIIVDGDGMVLSHPEWSYVLRETELRSLAPVALALGGKRGTAEHTDPLEGGNWLWAYQPLDSTAWAVAVRYPANTIFSPIYHTLLKWLLYCIGAVALALLLASISAERITLPLRRLMRRMEAVAPAGTIESLASSDLDELHTLTRAFSGICATLSQNSEELADLKDELSSQANKLEILSRRAIQAREEERRRLAMNIHDGVLQLIAVAQGEARLARIAARSRPEMVATRIEQMEGALDQALTELRGMARGVHLTALEEVGLVHAVYNHLIFVREIFGVPHLSLQVSGDPYQLCSEVEIAAFRIIQESLSNVGKHAQASSAQVYIDFAPSCFRLVVEDDGQGFDARDLDRLPDSHCGLVNVRQRAEGLGGQCTILSLPGQGTRIEIQLPCEDPALAPQPSATGAKG